MKRVSLLRHAKTEKALLTQDDSARVLTAKGREDASDLGKLLRKRGFSPDLVLCSPAARTRETLQYLGSTCPLTAKVEYAPVIYLAGPEQVIELWRELPDSVQHVLIIGHNPGLPQCAFLAAEDKSGAAQEVLQDFAPCSMADIIFDTTSWVACTRDSARVEIIQIS